MYLVFMEEGGWREHHIAASLEKAQEILIAEYISTYVRRVSCNRRRRVFGEKQPLYVSRSKVRVFVDTCDEYNRPIEAVICHEDFYGEIVEVEVE